MSLINCPECNSEISTEAETCPKCGHPAANRRKEVTPVVATTRENESALPKWVVPALVVLAAFTLFGVIYAMQNRDEPADREVVVDTLEPERTSESTKRIDAANDPLTEPQTREIPVPENDQTITADSKAAVPDSSVERGSADLDAKVKDLKGKIVAVEDEKFYLLDKELSEILRESRLQPIENNSLINSFGLSVLYPDKFSKFNSAALSAINDHIEYDTLTDAKGFARITNIRPGNYYIFGIHKIGKGFAIWSSPVTIKPGENNLNIQPQRPVEIASRGSY